MILRHAARDRWSMNRALRVGAIPPYCDTYMDHPERSGIPHKRWRALVATRLEIDVTHRT